MMGSSLEQGSSNVVPVLQPTMMSCTAGIILVGVRRLIEHMADRQRVSRRPPPLHAERRGDELAPGTPVA